MKARPPSRIGTERTVAALLLAGLAIVFVCLAFGHLIGIASAAIGLRADATAVFLYSYGTLAGVLTFVTGLALGILRARGIWPKSQSGQIEGAYVVSVSVLNAKQEPVWNEGAFDAATVRRYVQFRTPRGGTLELEADETQVGGLGEGQTGRLAYTGSRLVSFVPMVAEDRTPWIGDASG